jgi:phosphate-selective porin
MIKLKNILDEGIFDKFKKKPTPKENPLISWDRLKKEIESIDKKFPNYTKKDFNKLKQVYGKLYPNISSTAIKYLAKDYDNYRTSEMTHDFGFEKAERGDIGTVIDGQQRMLKTQI